jgi:hypothetical protein
MAQDIAHEDIALSSGLEPWPVASDRRIRIEKPALYKDEDADGD